MPTYVAFLRAINLGASRKFPKADIKAAVERAGGTDVETYINTGNVRLATGLRSRERVEQVLEKEFEADRGFPVPTIVFTPDELVGVAADARELSSARPDLARHYVYLLKAEPEAGLVEALQARRSDGAEAVVRGRAAHLLHGPGYQQGNVDPFNVEKALDVVATNRNLNVIQALAQRWC